MFISLDLYNNRSFYLDYTCRITERIMLRAKKSEFLLKYIVVWTFFLVPCVVFCAECPDGTSGLTTINSDTFISPINNICKAGYSIIQIDDTVFTPLFTGTLSGNAITLCSNGHYVNGTCVDWDAGECPNNYNDMGLADTTFSNTTAGSCATGYTTYEIESACSDNTSASICAIVSCSDNETLTSVGACGTPCTAGATALKIRKTDNTILSFPLWSSKLVTPSLNIQVSNGNVCYVNLTAGTGTDALNINYNGTIYHTTD